MMGLVRPIHVAAAVLVAALWGLNFVIIDVGLDDVPPLLLSCLRYVVASLPLLLLRGPRPAPWRWIVAAGTCIGIVQFSLLFLGMDAGMPAGLSSVVIQTQAFFTLGFATVLLGERPTAGQAAGVGLAFAGLLLIAGHLEGDATVGGFVLVLGAAAAWGLGNICVKRSGATDPLRFMTWICLVPPLPLLLLSLAFEGPGDIGAALSGLDLGDAGAILYLAFAATTVGWALWGGLMRDYPASTVAPFSLLVPVFGLSSSALLLGEPITLRALAGTALVVSGVLATLRAGRRPAARAAAATASAG
jgi:O-acetylserine/cysteine efflux transporter